MQKCGVRVFMAVAVVIGAIAGGCSVSVTVPTRFAKRQYEWLTMLQDPRNHVDSMWTGVPPGDVSESGTSIAFSGLTMGGASPLLGPKYETKLREEPLALLPAFGHPDPDAALTAAYLYDRLKFQTFDERVRDPIEQAIREALLRHGDVRVRWQGYGMLGSRALLRPEDYALGLNDPASDVRVRVAVLLDSEPLIENPAEAPDWLGWPPVRRHERRAALAATLLGQLNATHVIVRQKCGSALVALYTQPPGTGGGGGPAVPLPEAVDWVHADWATRRDGQERWKRWWEADGRRLLYDLDHARF